MMMIIIIIIITNIIIFNDKGASSEAEIPYGDTTDGIVRTKKLILF